MDATPSPSASVSASAAPSSATISQALAEFAASFSYEAIPAPVRMRAKHLVLDAIGIALASTQFEFAHRTLAALGDLGGTGGSAVVGFSSRLPLRDAVMMNGVLVHGLDYDDTHVPGIVHTSASSVPLALALAAHLDRSGRELLAAYVLAVEMSARLGSVAKGAFHQTGFHPTGLIGAFGCTLAAGFLYGMNAAQLKMAQGITLSLASGSLEFLQDGAWTKRIHPGWAGVAGITAASLARRGFIGPGAAYEGRFGLFPSYLGAHADQCDYSLATRGLGQSWEVESVAVKPYPACHFVHACTDAALALRAKGVRAGDIAHIRALVPEGVIKTVCEPVANKRRPANGYDAKFSIPYAVATAFVRGTFGLAELEEAALRDAQVLALADKVDYEADPNSGFPKWYSGEVIVRLKDGSELAHREQMNRGSADRPLSDEEIVAKFMDNAQLAVSPSRARQIREAVLALDDRGAMARDLEAALAG